MLTRNEKELAVALMHMVEQDFILNPDGSVLASTNSDFCAIEALLKNGLAKKEGYNRFRLLWENIK